eukprot:11209107-Lingulodinium_polyedra.AAC.1
MALRSSMPKRAQWPRKRSTCQPLTARRPKSHRRPCQYLRPSGRRHRRGPSNSHPRPSRAGPASSASWQWNPT